MPQAQSTSQSTANSPLEDGRQIHFLYEPVKLSLAATVINFLSYYTHNLYPKTSINVINSFRNLMRNISLMDRESAAAGAKYRMEHFSEVRDSKHRYAVVERFSVGSLSMSVHNCTEQEKNELHQYVCMRRGNQPKSFDLTAGDVALLIGDELRLDCEYWESKKVYGSVHGPLLLKQLLDYFKNRTGGLVIVHSFKIDKQEEKAKISFTLAIPSVINYCLKFDCDFQ